MFPKNIYLVLFLLIIIAINDYHYFLHNKCFFFKLYLKIPYYSSFTNKPV